MTADEKAAVRAFAKNLLPAANQDQIATFVDGIDGAVTADEAKAAIAASWREGDSKYPNDVLVASLRRLKRPQIDGMREKGSRVVFDSREAREATQRRNAAMRLLFQKATAEQLAEARRRAEASLKYGCALPTWDQDDLARWCAWVDRMDNDEQPMRGAIARHLREMIQPETAGAA